MVNSNDEEEESNNEQKDDEGYTTSKSAYLNCIDKFEAASNANNEDNDNDNNKVDDDEGEKEKDEAYYRKKERALKHVELITKLRKHIKEARSMQHLVTTAVAKAKEGTQTKVPISQIYVVAILDSYLNI